MPKPAQTSGQLTGLPLRSHPFPLPLPLPCRCRRFPPQALRQGYNDYEKGKIGAHPFLNAVVFKKARHHTHIHKI